VRAVLRALRSLLIAAGLLLLLYLAAANLVLSTRVLDPIINRKPEKLLVEWSGGHSLFPGRVHVRGFRARGQSRGMQWQCRLDEGDFRISLFQLARKRIRIHRGRGGGFEFLARQRLAEDGSENQTARHLPQIEGLSNPPDPSPEDLYPPKKRAPKRRWIIDAGDIRLNGPVDLWLGRLRLVGIGEIGGEVHYEVGEDLAVPDLLFDLDDAHLDWESLTVAEQLHIDVAGELRPFAVQTEHGSEVLRHLAGSIELSQGIVPDLGVLGSFLPRSQLIDVADGRGDLYLKLDADGGSGDTEGRVELAFQRAEVTILDAALVGDLALSATLDEGDLGRGSFRFGEAELRVDNVGETDAERDEQAWWAHVRVTDGTVQLDEPSRIEAGLSFSLRDTGPLIWLIAGQENDDGERKLPIALRLIPNVKDLAGSAHVDITQEAVLIENVDVQGDGLRIKTWLHLDEAPDGLFYFRFKGVPLGLELDDGKRNLRFRRPLRWYEEQLALETQGEPTSSHER
jgi:hypothetical protein